MRKFAKVDDKFMKVQGATILPVRATKKSAGYDFFSKSEYVAEKGEVVKVWTDVKAYMEDDEVLLLDVRSSMGGKWELINTLGIIDADYVDTDKGGNIGVFLKNTSDTKQYIHPGDRIAQGVFVKYLVTDDDQVDVERTGGHGSTGN